MCPNGFRFPQRIPSTLLTLMLSQYAIGSYVAFTRIYPDEYNRLEYEKIKESSRKNSTSF